MSRSEIIIIQLHGLQAYRSLGCRANRFCVLFCLFLSLRSLLLLLSRYCVFVLLSPRYCFIFIVVSFCVSFWCFSFIASASLLHYFVFFLCIDVYFFFISVLLHCFIVLLVHFYNCFVLCFVLVFLTNFRLFTASLLRCIILQLRCCVFRVLISSLCVLIYWFIAF